MSASRSFIDVLVGKLTAYVDDPSRPASSVPASIQTPWWMGALDGQPVYGGSAARAYTTHAPHVTAPAAAPVNRVPAPVRTPAQHTAIALLQRLGATGIDGRSTDAELRSACRHLVRAAHPDGHGDLTDADRAALSTRLRAVLRAKDVLDLPAPRAVVSAPQATSAAPVPVAA